MEEAAEQGHSNAKAFHYFATVATGLSLRCLSGIHLTLPKEPKNGRLRR